MGFIQKSSSKPTQAASNVIRSSLRIRRSDQAVLVFDSFGQEVAEAFIESAKALRQTLLPVYAPYSVQADTRRLGARSSLRVHIEASAALITCLTDAHETTDFRRAILDCAVKGSVQCVHMPGVTEDILVDGALSLNIRRLDRRASILAEMLTRANTAEIHTFSQRAQSEHKLTLSLVNRRGHADGGIARGGHVINMPTGEAYIAPVEASACGSIVINGSFPERDLSRGGELVLFIQDGVPDLERSEIPEDGTGDYCRELLVNAHTADFRHFQIGELGLGLNPSIRSATGRTILDEKAFGSAHIALGSNTTFGGKNRAPYHHDLVFYPTAIYLDGAVLANEWHTPARRLWDE